MSILPSGTWACRISAYDLHYGQQRLFPISKLRWRGTTPWTSRQPNGFGPLQLKWCTGLGLQQTCCSHSVFRLSGRRPSARRWALVQPGPGIGFGGPSLGTPNPSGRFFTAEMPETSGCWQSGWWATTAAHALQLSSSELSALGDWQ